MACAGGPAQEKNKLWHKIEKKLASDMHVCTVTEQYIDNISISRYI